MKWFKHPSTNMKSYSSLTWEERGMLAEVIEVCLQQNDFCLSTEWLQKILGIQRRKSEKIIGKFSEILAEFSENLGVFSENLGEFSGNLGEFSGNLGEFSGNSSVFSENLGKFSENLVKKEASNPHGSIKDRENRENREKDKIEREKDSFKIPNTEAEKETEFQAWYKEYPNKKAVGEARKAYWKARKTVPAEILLDGVSRYRDVKPAYAEWKYPATWLNQQCWLDEAAPVQVDSRRPAIPVKHEKTGVVSFFDD